MHWFIFPLFILFQSECKMLPNAQWRYFSLPFFLHTVTLYHVTWHICEPSKWSGIKNPQSEIKVTIQISVHYHVIALGVSLEAMQIDTDVTFCSKISWSQQKVKKVKKVHIFFSDMIACKPIRCFKNHWVLRLWRLILDFLFW